jgi:hypothetical protein
MTATLIAYLAAFILSFTWSGFLSTAMPLYGGEVVGVSTSTLGMVLTAGLLVDLALCCRWDGCRIGMIIGSYWRRRCC